MGAITRPADALLFHRLLNAGFGRGLDGGRDGGTRPFGRVEALIAGHWVARADIRVEVDGGVSLLVGEAAHAVKYAADSVQN